LSKTVIRAVKQSIGTKAEIVTLPFFRRSKKEDGKFEKLMKKGKCKKAHRKYGYNSDRIAWDWLWPKVSDPVRRAHHITIPIEGVPSGVVERHHQRLKERMKKAHDRVELVTDSVSWVRYLMQHR
jgi:hypothetical protein